MAAGLFKAPTSNYVSTTLNGAINASVDTITVSDASSLQAPGYIVINREDGNGTATPNSREVVKFTGISSNDLTGCTRGADSSTARSHADGSLVEPTYTVGMHNDQRDAINAEHSTDGTHSIVANVTITNAKIANAITNAATVSTLTAINEPAGVSGQFYWARSGSLATVLHATATDTHFPVQRITKNLTANDIYVALTSAPSLAAFQTNISFGSSPTGDFASIFSTKPTIDIGEYDTSSAATPAVFGQTSLASGGLLRFEIDAHGDSGGMAASMSVTSR